MAHVVGSLQQRPDQRTENFVEGKFNVLQRDAFRPREDARGSITVETGGARNRPNIDRQAS